jgi:hypothetical protein
MLILPTYSPQQFIHNTHNIQNLVLPDCGIKQIIMWLFNLFIICLWAIKIFIFTDKTKDYKYVGLLKMISELPIEEDKHEGYCTPIRYEISDTG